MCSVLMLEWVVCGLSFSEGQRRREGGGWDLEKRKERAMIGKQSE